MPISDIWFWTDAFVIGERNILSILTWLSKIKLLTLIPNAISFAEIKVSFLYGAEPLSLKFFNVKVNDGK